MNIKEAVNVLHGLIDDIHFALSEGGDEEYANNIYEMEKTISKYVENHEMPFITGLTITASTSDELPIAKYVPLKQGRWIYEDTDGVISLNGYECSVCHNYNGRATKYCPHCGAYMEVK